TDVIERVRVWLEWPPDEVGRLVALDEHRSDRPSSLPDEKTAHEILRGLDVPPPAVDEIVAAMPSSDSDPEAWWLLERCYWALVCDDPSPPPWPAPWVTPAAFTRYFHIYVFLAALPDVLRKHAARGIPPEITWATLGDVGLQVAHYHARFGAYGFDG